MPYEISVHKLDDEILLAELRNLVRYFQGLGHERCEVLFGWHWGMEYYPSSTWVAEDIPLAELEAKVRQVEATGLGRLCGDDLFVKIPDLDCEFCFCHHSGIHLKSSQSGEIEASFQQRWRSQGLALTERDVIS